MEGLRIDPAHEIGPLRLNQVVAAVVFASLFAVLARCAYRRGARGYRPRQRRRPASAPAAAGRGGTITRTVVPPPGSPRSHRAADARGALAHRVDALVDAAGIELLERAAAVVGDRELDAALPACGGDVTACAPACLTVFARASWAIR